MSAGQPLHGSNKSKAVSNDKRIRLSPAAVFVESIRVFVDQALALGKLSLGAVAGILLIGLGISSYIGLSRDQVINPRTIPMTLARIDWFLVVTSIFLASGILFVTLTAIIHFVYGHVACKTISLKQAIQSVKMDQLWLLWLQLLIAAITISFYPWAAVVLWLLIANAVPVAVLEGLLPNHALDRAWELMEGNRIKVFGMTAIQVTLWVVPPLLLVPLTLGQDFSLGPEAIPTPLKVILGIPACLFVLSPIAYSAIVHTVIYHHLRGGSTPNVLHAKAAGGVN